MSTPAAPAPLQVEDIVGSGRRRTKLILTPGGVPLRVELGEIGERAVAFLIDIAVTLIASNLLYFILLLTFDRLRGASMAAAAFFFFLMRVGYFTFFELRWAGSTPGKRRLRLRVIDRFGGPLTPQSVIARNLTREVEFFFPFLLLVSGGTSASGAWGALAMILWLFLMLLFPLFNRDRLRAGDLLGGTLVISVPHRVLLDDLFETQRSFTFSEQHLQHYGILELQVLEEVLRRPYGPDTIRLEDEVCEKISRRIGWTTPIVPELRARFLRDFYTAQRGYLERRKHFGDERLDKHHAQSGKGAGRP